MSAKDYTDSYHAQRRSTGLAYVLAAALLLVGLMTVWWLVRRWLSPLADVVAVMEQLSQGDLTRPRITVHSRDEIGQLFNAHQRTVTRLHDMIQHVKETSSAQNTSAAKLKTVAAETHLGVTRQQAEIAHMAGATQQLLGSAHDVAEHALKASESARVAQQSSEQGMDVVQRTVSAIEGLAQEVHRAAAVIQRVESGAANIGGVLDVIKGVADQTNLLALNAAIEAARAGEQGRGFAVVADEVRTLASRTQQSTREIQQMIEQLQQASKEAVQVMEQGLTHTRSTVEQAAQAGGTLQSIHHAVQTITAMNIHIAAAAEEQSTVAAEINRNIQSIVTETNKTAIDAQTLSDTGGELSQLAERCQGLLQEFRV